MVTDVVNVGGNEIFRVLKNFFRVFIYYMIVFYSVFIRIFVVGTVVIVVI